jgi:hypothetical protein
MRRLGGSIQADNRAQGGFQVILEFPATPVSAEETSA